MEGEWRGEREGEGMEGEWRGEMGVPGGGRWRREMEGGEGGEGIEDGG
jgi:hypothetical protein